MVTLAKHALNNQEMLMAQINEALHPNIYISAIKKPKAITNCISFKDKYQ
jgi:hypothetical protein